MFCLITPWYIFSLVSEKFSQGNNVCLVSSCFRNYGLETISFFLPPNDFEILFSTVLIFNIYQLKLVQTTDI